MRAAALLVTALLRAGQSAPLSSSEQVLSESSEAVLQASVRAQSSSLPSCATEPSSWSRDFLSFCTPTDDSLGCWPSMFILGVQKAATTSVATVLSGCGLVSYAKNDPDSEYQLPGRCSAEPDGCKESHALDKMIPFWKQPLSLRPLEAKQAAYTRLFKRGGGSHARSGDPSPYPHPSAAAEAGRFLEATPNYLQVPAAPPHPLP